MRRLGRNRRTLSIVVAVIGCFAAVIASIALAYSASATVDVPALGSEWRCHRVMIVTICRYIGKQASLDGRRLAAEIRSFRVD
jgi:hypothetical protein